MLCEGNNSFDETMSVATAVTTRRRYVVRHVSWEIGNCKRSLRTKCCTVCIGIKERWRFRFFLSALSTVIIVCRFYAGVARTTHPGTWYHAAIRAIAVIGCWYECIFVTLRCSVGSSAQRIRWWTWWHRWNCRSYTKWWSSDAANVTLCGISITTLWAWGWGIAHSMWHARHRR